MNDSTNIKRTLFIASQPFFQWRGSPIRLGFDVKAISENGYDVDFLTLPIGERKDVPGVRILRAPNVFFAKNISIGPSLLKLLFDAVMFVQALFLICRRHYDVVHGVEDCGLSALILGRLCRGAVVFEKHSDSASYKKGLVISAYAAVEKFVIRHADAVIGTGPGLVAQAKKIAPGVKAFHICDIPSSLAEPDETGTKSARAEMAKSMDDVIATYVGSFASYQGIDLLFGSMPEAIKSCPNLRFIIIGGTPAEIAERTEWLQGQGVENRVSFIGKKSPDKLPCYLAASDILLSPRVAGVNTPLKLLDYLKVARCIVATSHESNRLILDESTAIFASADTESFAAAVTRAAVSPGLRADLASHCRRLVDEKYNFNVFREGLRRCYESLSANHA